MFGLFFVLFTGLKLLRYWIAWSKESIGFLCQFHVQQAVCGIVYHIVVHPCGKGGFRFSLLSLSISLLAVVSLVHLEDLSVKLF